MTKIKLHWQILGAIVLAGLAGYLAGEESSIFGVTFYSMFDFAGTLFLNALKMIIVPLIMASIISGIAGLGSSQGLGRLGAKTISFYMISSLVAILVGLAVVNIVQPGIIDGQPAGPQLGLTTNAEETETMLSKVEGKDGGDIAEVFLRMVPTNIVKAASDGQMLGLIFFAILFAVFMMKLEKQYSEPMKNLWEGLFQTMMGITMFVMMFAPIGVFGLVAKTVAKTGLESILPMLTFFATVLGALMIHAFITLPVLLKTVAKVNPIKHIKAMSPAMLTAFSTASSSATLPLSLKCIEENAGVSNRTSSFVLPLGATINMDGTALYECVAAMFIAQAYGLELSLTIQFTIVLVALLTSIGVAGIPSASLVAITIILGSIGLPAEGIGLLLVTDRILDMCRTSVNVFSDSCGAVMIARTEGEKTLVT
ncbi:dicarboxylate/amino acid:cation symporter [Gammaproteobacteria bacterium 45_16_T64]|nr:dicarboxylate/amino acid:cation symporter [Gammaproteobacteria bacterium 45_16_T64]